MTLSKQEHSQVGCYTRNMALSKCSKHGRFSNPISSMEKVVNIFVNLQIYMAQELSTMYGHRDVFQVNVFRDRRLIGLCMKSTLLTGCNDTNILVVFGLRHLEERGMSMGN